MTATRLAGCLLLLAGTAAGAAPGLDFTLNATPSRRVNLDGNWRLARDPENAGKAAGWFLRSSVEGAVEAQVPNPLELSFPGYNGVVWYWRTFEAGDLASYDDVRIHFHGADYYAEAWLNGQYLGGNESALLPFAFNIKKALKTGVNRLVVRVIDASYAKEIDGFQLGHVPGGRQHDDPWEPGFRHQNYGGLLLPVEVEAFRRPWIADAFIRPEVNQGRIRVDLRMVGGTAGEWTATVKPAFPKPGAAVTRRNVALTPDGQGKVSITLAIPHARSWKVWDPLLYELALTPAGGGTGWHGRFGMREVSLRSGRIAINGQEILQRSYLYNQIWPVTLGVPYKDLARRDIELVRKTNANMLRCFSKTPLPATVEAADEAGILLQPESLASWYLKTGPRENERLREITERAVLLYRNHPSIVWWNVLNENMPNLDPQRPYPANEFTLGPYTLQTVLPEVHELDPTRPVIANDPIWHDVNNIWEPGLSKPSLPLVQDHYYQFTDLENHEDSWQKIRGRAWGEKPKPGKPFLAVTEWGLNSAPEWDRLLASYKASGVRQDAEDYALYRKDAAMNRKWYDKSGIREQGFPTYESVAAANREAVAWHYREHFALFWGNIHCVGQGLTSFDDSSYELSGVVDNWRNPKPVVFDTITELNRPLQVNLWLRPSSVYVGDKVLFDATLVNEGGRLPAGKYPLSVALVDARGRKTFHEESSHEVGSEPIEYLLSDAIPVTVPAGAYRLEVELGTGARKLTATRPIVVFARKPQALPTGKAVWVWEKSALLKNWLAKRSVEPRSGEPGAVRTGDILLVMDAPPAALQGIQGAVRRGGSAVILNLEKVLASAKPSGSGYEKNYSGLLESIAKGWKPELREISWWGKPGAWGYGRTALALQHRFLGGLPQGVALEAQPEYQRVAPQYTWVMEGQPEDLRADRAVVESNLEVDMPYTADLMTLPLGDGKLVLTSLRIGENLNSDPAADRILENILRSLE